MTFVTARQDEVSNIHKRWSLTRINPSSSKTSFAISLVCGTILIVASHLFHLQQQTGGAAATTGAAAAAAAGNLAFYLPLGLGTLVGAHMLDYLALRGTPVNKLSKVAHVSAFANILWTLTVLLGVAADLVFSRQPGADYIVAGMLLAVGFRIGIFISVFGARTGRAIAVSFIQPLVFFLAFVPQSFYYPIFVSSAAGFAFGCTFVALGVLWTVLADRAGRPGVSSTFGLLQAFLAAWTENKVDKMEEFMEARARDDIVATKIMRFAMANGSHHAAIVLPDVHPGPFSMVGGSNLPYVLYETFYKKALIMHSVSDHSLNIPSKGQIDRYIKSLTNTVVAERGNTCTAPAQVKINKATATGIAFGNTAVVMLSLAPTGMEDVPQAIRTELESHGLDLGFAHLLVIDCHNAMGRPLNDADRKDLLAAARQCLGELKKRPQHQFKVGFANLDSIPRKLGQTHELGQAGLAVIVISVDSKNYAIGWADSNNMENGLRDYIISKVSNSSGIGGSSNIAINMLEVCSSDTHSTSGKRTREGYFALGTRSSADEIAAAYQEMCRKAVEELSSSTFELAAVKSTIKVMGKQQFEDYSYALDKSMNITKIFVAITVATFIAMLILS